MRKYSTILLKTDPALKEQAVKTASKLGISISAVLNNELKRFATEQSVIFELPEIPTPQTAKQLAKSKKEVESGVYNHFKDQDQSFAFLAHELE